MNYIASYFSNTTSDEEYQVLMIGFSDKHHIMQKVYRDLLMKPFDGLHLTNYNFNI